MLPQELQFFIDCAIYKYGKEAVETITPNEFLKSQVDLLFQKLERRSFHRDWSSYDPVHKLLNLIARQDSLQIEIKKARTKFVSQNNEAKDKVSMPSYDPVEHLTVADSVKFEVRPSVVGKTYTNKPIVFVIAQQRGIQLNGKPIRAQSHYVQSSSEARPYDNEGRKDPVWHVTNAKGQYMPMKDVRGHFTIVSIYGAGDDIEVLIPGIDPKHISTDDLSNLVDNLELVANRSDSIEFGLKHYHVA